MCWKVFIESAGKRAGENAVSCCLARKPVMSMRERVCVGKKVLRESAGERAGENAGKSFCGESVENIS